MRYHSLSITILIIWILFAISASPVRAQASGAAQLAFVSDRDGNREIYLATLNGDQASLVNLSNNPGDDHSPQFSPDGIMLYYISDRYGHSSVVAVNPNDYQFNELIAAGGTIVDFAVSPDYSMMIYVDYRFENNHYYFEVVAYDFPTASYRVLVNPVEDVLFRLGGGLPREKLLQWKPKFRIPGSKNRQELAPRCCWIPSMAVGSR